MIIIFMFMMFVMSIIIINIFVGWYYKFDDPLDYLLFNGGMVLIPSFLMFDYKCCHLITTIFGLFVIFCVFVIKYGVKFLNYLEERGKIK